MTAELLSPITYNAICDAFEAKRERAKKSRPPRASANTRLLALIGRSVEVASRPALLFQPWGQPRPVPLGE